jgi:hypothetical protein
MDADLKQHLEELEARLNERLEDVEARLKAHTSGQIDAAEQRLEGKLDAAEQRLEGKLDAAEQRLKDFVRNSKHEMETRIVAEFQRWGRTSDMRTKDALTDLAALAERMLAVEHRVSALERRTH